MILVRNLIVGYHLLRYGNFRKTFYAADAVVFSMNSRVLGFPHDCKPEVRWMFTHLDAGGDGVLSAADLYALREYTSCDVLGRGNSVVY